MSVDFVENRKWKKSLFSENHKIMSVHHLDKRGKFDTNCLDTDPRCFIRNGTQPLFVSATDATGKVVTICDLVNNVPACEMIDFSDTPEYHARSEANLLELFDTRGKTVVTFEPTSRGMSNDYRKYQFVNPNTLPPRERQRCEDVKMYPPPVSPKPAKMPDDFIPLDDYSVSEIMSALPGVSSANPVTLED